MSIRGKRRSSFYWLVPAAFLAHVVEELPRFPQWATRHFGTTTTQFYLVSHAVLVPALVGASARGARRPSDSRAAFLATTVSSGLGINAIFHIATTVLFREYSPGVVTGAVGMLPAAAYTLYRTKRAGILSDEQIVGAVLAGTAITTAVVGSLYVNMPPLGGKVETDW
jgi:hypothetical protein